jgi:hypothetical protein
MKRKLKKNDVVVIHNHVCGNPNCVEGNIGVVLGYEHCDYKDRVIVEIEKNFGRSSYKLEIIEKIGEL